MSRGCLFAGVLVFVFASLGLGQTPFLLQIPLGITPILDGTIDDQEWADALAVEWNADSALFLKQTTDYLFLAFRATTMGVPSPLIVREEQVHVLHASAALGTAIYAQDGDTWRLQQGFHWQCRGRGFAPSVVAEREQFLAREGWLGTIGYLGAPTEFEFMIRLDGHPLRILVLFMEAFYPPDLLSWPISTDEASEYLELITGPVPDEISFNLDQWAILDFALD